MNTRVIQSGSSSSRSRLSASKILVVFWFLLSCFLAFNPEPWEGHGREYGTEFNCISLQTLSGESAETGRQMKTDKTMWILEKEKSVWKDGWQGGFVEMGKCETEKETCEHEEPNASVPTARVLFQERQSPGADVGSPRASWSALPAASPGSPWCTFKMIKKQLVQHSNDTGYHFVNCCCLPTYAKLNRF